MKYATITVAFLLLAQLGTCFQVETTKAEISGRVTGVRGSAPSMDVVLYNQEGEQVGKAFSDENATFYMEGIPAGDYQLRLIHPDSGAQVYQTEVSIADGQEQEFVEIAREDLDI